MRPEVADWWCDRSLARLQTGDVEKVDLEGAIADASKAIDLAPGMARAWAIRAWARCERESDVEEAIADATKAIELDPKDGLARLARGIARSRSRKPGAASDLEECIRLGSGHEDWVTRARDELHLLSARGD